jgi:hypothetical protein
MFGPPDVVQPFSSDEFKLFYRITWSGVITITRILDGPKFRRDLTRNPLQNIPSDLFPRPVIKADGSGVGTSGELLNVFARDALFEQIGDGGNAEGMRREEQGHVEVLEPSLHHASWVALPVRSIPPFRMKIERAFINPVSMTGIV